MVDPRDDSDIAPNAVAESDRGSGTPRWVKAFAVVAALAVLLLAVSLATGVDHGPGRHAPPGTTAPSGDTGSHRPPTGGHTEPSR